VAGIERIVFFGTPAVSVPALDALVRAGRTPALVVSRPARPAGRGRRLAEPPVAVRARELGLRVAQPAKVGEAAFLELLRALAPDLAVVVAFGQIFPRALLDLPRLGCLNVHFSLLPRWRGAAPVAAAIAAGDAETGVSIQRLDEGLDTGPVYAVRATPIADEEHAGELGARLAGLGAELLVEVVDAVERGTAVAAPQDAARATHAPKLGGMEPLDPAQPAPELARRVRAFNPEPGTFLPARGERLKVMRASASSVETKEKPGTIVGVGPRSLALAAGGGTVLELERTQRPGGRPLSGRELANGLRLRVGERLS
jgi:methionyl-tRNA formyltransferase